MKPQTISVSRTIAAPAEEVYKIISNYRVTHPLILPKPYFLSLEVEVGGIGAGTIIQFQMRMFGQTQTFRAQISEPEPGHVLVETDRASGVVTRFIVLPLKGEPGAQVTISTELQGRNVLEGFLAKWMLRKIYVQELELLARLSEKQSAATQPDSYNNSSTTSL